MRAITHGAAEAIKQIVTSSQMLDEGGIRISVEPVTTSARLELWIAEGVVERDWSQDGQPRNFDPRRIL